MKKILILTAVVLLSAVPALANRHAVPSRYEYRQYVQRNYVQYDQRRYRMDARYRALIDRRVNQIVDGSYGRNDSRYTSYYRKSYRNNRHHR